MLDVAAAHPEFVVVRAGDVGDDAVRKARAAHPDVEFTSPQEVLDASDLDAVYIATPPAFHADAAIAAMRSGKAVLCEKPLAVSAEDGRRMNEVADETGVATGVNFALSDTNATHHVERSLRSGEVGDVVGVDVRLTFPLWPRAFQATATWVGEREQGGFIREVFSHFAYLTDRLVGPVRPVNASVDYPEDPKVSEIAARGFVRAGDVPVQVSGFAGVTGAETYEWTLWGTKKSYQLRAWRDLYISDGAGWTRVEPEGEAGSEATRLALFARAIRGEKPESLADFAAAYRVQQVVEAFHAGSSAE